MCLSGAKLYRLQDGHVLPANEELYQTEADLQHLIAENPQLLLRDPDDETQHLYLIQQEHPLREAPGSPSAYSLDHLFIDQDGVPVLVEVKRSTDTRIRREVVGQMLDYAARIRTWTAEELRSLASLSQGIPDTLWRDVEDNLKAERMKLIFVADAIPDSLAVLIDFMDRSMENIEVCGVEVRQYRTADGATLISSSVIGGTATQEKRVVRPAVVWDDAAIASQLRQYGNLEAIPIVSSLATFINEAGLSLDYGKGTKFGLFRALRNGRKVFSVTSWEKNHAGLRTAIELSLSSLADQTAQHFDEQALRTMLFSFPDISAADRERYIFGSTRFQYIDIRLLMRQDNMAHFKEAMQQIVNAIPLQ